MQKRKKKVKCHSFTEIQSPRLELAAADQLQWRSTSTTAQDYWCKLLIVADQCCTAPELSWAILLSLEFSIDYRCSCFECLQMRACNVIIAQRSRAALAHSQRLSQAAGDRCGTNPRGRSDWPALSGWFLKTGDFFNVWWGCCLPPLLGFLLKTGDDAANMDEQKPSSS